MTLPEVPLVYPLNINLAVLVITAFLFVLIFVLPLLTLEYKDDVISAKKFWTILGSAIFLPVTAFVILWVTYDTQIGGWNKKASEMLQIDESVVEGSYLYKSVDANEGKRVLVEFPEEWSYDSQEDSYHHDGRAFLVDGRDVSIVNLVDFQDLELIRHWD